MGTSVGKAGMMGRLSTISGGMAGGAPGISAQILQKEISSLRKELEKKIAGAI